MFVFFPYSIIISRLSGLIALVISLVIVYQHIYVWGDNVFSNGPIQFLNTDEGKKFIYPQLLLQEWMIIKLFIVGGLYFYQIKTHRIFLELQRDSFRYSSFFMRVWNEIATVILFSVVFLAILKSKFDWLFGVLGLIFLTIILIFSVKLYKKWRERK